MELFEELRLVADKKDEEGEFPSWLFADILDIAGDPERYGDKEQLVEQLISQIKNFDLYAGAGCFDTSVGADTIGETIRRIKSV